MPYLLRGIRKTRWLSDPSRTWLPVNEVPADCLGDLQTTDCELSVWVVERDRSNLARVVTALAATRDTLSEFSYRLVPIEWVKRHRLQLNPTPGETPDEEANDRWHGDLQYLSGVRLVSLARCMWHRGELARITESRMKILLSEGVQSHQLDATKLKPGLAQKLGLIS
jgi:hypothetical protein